MSQPLFFVQKGDCWQVIMRQPQMVVGYYGGEKLAKKHCAELNKRYLKKKKKKSL